ncbi:MAG: hypothetical protein ACOX6T_24530 [Myxococcales bacterium]|jgi:hypothetical protein
MERRFGRGRAWLAGCVFVAALAVGACGDDPDTAKGSSPVNGWIVVNNLSAKDAEIYIDAEPVGTVEAGQSATYEGLYAGERELRADATDGSAWWGPVRVTIEKGSLHTWNLHDAAE